MIIIMLDSSGAGGPFATTNDHLFPDSPHTGPHRLTSKDMNMTQGTTSNSLGTAVITGASAGIGKVYADRLAARGYDLLLVARREDRLKSLAETLHETYGVTVETITADLAVPSDLAVIAARLKADQQISLLINNAGTSTLGSVAETSLDAIEAMNAVNLTALVRLTATVLPGFKQRDAGTIINIGSVLGFKSLPISTIYSSTKAYVTFLTRGLQQELADTNVRVQLVAPAATATDIWEISGVPLSHLDPATVMTVDAMVDASLSGLDQGEAVTLPSVENAEALLAAYDEASLALLGQAQSGEPASRYKAPATIAS
jgi:short-subunit dehydrogenase